MQSNPFMLMFVGLLGQAPSSVWVSGMDSGFAKIPRGFNIVMELSEPSAERTVVFFVFFATAVILWPSPERGNGPESQSLSPYAHGSVAMVLSHLCVPRTLEPFPARCILERPQSCSNLHAATCGPWEAENSHAEMPPLMPAPHWPERPLHWGPVHPL